MDTARATVFLVAGLILLTTLASGPLVGVLEPPSNEPENVGTGTATLTVQSAPETAVIDAAQNTDVLYLEVPDAVIEITDVQGNPVLSYSLSINDNGLSYSRGSVYFLGDRGVGTHQISLSPDTFDSEEITADEYAGTLTLIVRGETERTILERNVTVEVRR